MGLANAARVVVRFVLSTLIWLLMVAIFIDVIAIQWFML
jgi:hypothetical protein